jgi:uncharacterized protein involved in exopolysaccharide biosynthesis
MMMTKSAVEIIHSILAGAWRRRIMICIPVLILPLIGFAVGKLSPKTYEARMTIRVQEAIKPDSYPGEFLETDISQRMPVLEALIRSSQIMGAVASDAGLVSPSMSERERDDVIRQLSSNLTINLIGGSWIELRLRGSSKDTLNQRLAQIGNRLIAQLVDPESSSIATSMKFLQLQIDARELLLRAVERNLFEFKDRNAEKLPERHDDNVKRLVELRQLLENRRTALSNAAAEVTDLQSALGATSPVVKQLDEDIVRLSSELALLQSNYTEEHPSLQAIARQLRSLEDQRIQAIALINTFVADNVDRFPPLTVGLPEQVNRQPLLAPLQLEKWREARRRQVTLEEEIAQLQNATDLLQATVSGQTRVGSELAGLERDLNVQRDAYEKLATRLDTARMSQELSSTTERAKIIDAYQQPEALGPSAREFTLAGVLGGLILGFCLAVAAELTDSSVRSRAALERITGVRLLGRIPATTDNHTVAAMDRHNDVFSSSRDIRRSTGS